MLPPPQLVLEAVAHGLIVPAAVTAAGLALARWWGRPRGEPARAGAEALAVAAGLFAGFAALAGSRQLGWEFLQPADAWHWLPLLAVTAAAAGVPDRLPSLPAAARWLLRLAVAGLTAWLLVRAESAVQAVHPAWHAALAAAVLALWGVLDRAVPRRPGFVLPTLLALTAVGAAAVLEAAGIMKFAQSAGVLAAVLGGAACVARRYRPGSPARAAVPALAVMLPGLLFAGWFNTFSNVPAASYLLVLATPLAVGLTALFPPAGLEPRRQGALAAVAALVPLGLAVTLALLAE
jgi:hypothetical protein